MRVNEKPVQRMLMREGRFGLDEKFRISAVEVTTIAVMGEFHSDRRATKYIKVMFQLKKNTCDFLLSSSQRVQLRT